MRRGDPSPVAARRGTGERAAILGLVLIAAAIWVRIYDFSENRFFTVDEYQFGHATWLVSQGQVPYVDFYEHHFPLSYAVHAPLLPSSGDFASRALWLRKAAFAWAAAASLALAAGTWVVARSAPMALLCAALPASFGFGLMSAIDYRADNFAAFGWLVVLAMLEANRVWRRRAVAAACGVGAALVVGMTQKMLFVAGGALALMWVGDRAGWLGVGDGRGPRIAHPGVVIAAGAASTAVALAVAAAFGMLGPGWDDTIAFGFEHEALYHRVPLSDYALPFLARTPLSTPPLLAVCAVALFARVNRFWLPAVAVAAVGGLLLRAQFPYNYVLLGYLLVHCGARGYTAAIERIPRTAVAALRPAALLLPLAVVPDQIGFALDTSSNARQLELLDRIERYSGPDDAVIDAAGAALFRPHASRYWYHGSAHRKLWADALENDLVGDYRASRALFWIRDFRTDELSRNVQRYLRRHYVHAAGDLWALGFLAPPAREGAGLTSIDVIRAGEYFVHPLQPGSVPPTLASGPGGARGGLEIDGAPVEGGRVQLAEGAHRVRVEPGSPGYVLSPLPTGAFRALQSPGPSGPHTPLFEYDRDTRGRWSL